MTAVWSDVFLLNLIQNIVCDLTERATTDYKENVLFMFTIHVFIMTAHTQRHVLAVLQYVCM